MRMRHVVCGLPCSTKCFHVFHKRHDFRKELLNLKCVFWFSLQHLSEKCLILRRTERDTIKIVYWSSCKVPFLPIIMKREFSIHIFEKYSNIKFCEYPSRGSRVVPYGQTADMTKLKVVFSQFLWTRLEAEKLQNILSACHATLLVTYDGYIGTYCVYVVW
jgi:hypothetical protein